MRLLVLVDNNTYIDRYYLGEPAVSYYLEDGDRSILLDTGYSDVFMKNAKSLGVDLNRLDTLVFSHGHNDHTGGLSPFLSTVRERQIEVVAHPLAFLPKRAGQQNISSPVPESGLLGCRLRLGKLPVQVSENLTFLGEIPSSFDFEARRQIGERLEDGLWKPDFVEDDSALVYRGREGLVIITGCSHSGICNIAEYAKKVCREERIASIIGGFHLFDLDDRAKKTIAYLERLQMKTAYPCHCTSFAVRAAMSRVCGIQEVGVGLELKWT